MTSDPILLSTGSNPSVRQRLDLAMGDTEVTDDRPEATGSRAHTGS